MARRASDPADRPDDAVQDPVRGRSEPLITRADLAGWVDGPGGGRTAGRWPGDLIGLPQHGPASMATAIRRFGALCIDWALALLVSGLAFGGDACWLRLSIWMLLP